jgi:large subunit ribosomal protein L31e
MIREYVQKHKNTPRVKIDQELAQLIWARGVRRPPRKVTVELIDDGGEVLVVPYSESISEEAPPLKEDTSKAIDAEESAIEDTSAAAPAGALPGEVSDAAPEPPLPKETQDQSAEPAKTDKADQEEPAKPTKGE